LIASDLIFEIDVSSGFILIFEIDVSSGFILDVFGRLRVRLVTGVRANFAARVDQPRRLLQRSA
jgi:hypothetical protein